MRKAPITEMFMHIDDWWASTQWHSPYEPMSDEMLAQHERNKAAHAKSVKLRKASFEVKLRARFMAKRAAK